MPGAVVLLDGAGIPGADALCRHGVRWYTRRLGDALLGRLARDDGRSLADLLADAIDEVAGEHRTCDLADPSSPQATVAVVRVREGRLEHLLLADSFVVLDPVSRPADRPADRSAAPAVPVVLTDGREVTVRKECTAPLAGVPEGTPHHERVLADCVTAFRARRNQPGGYWIAKDDPRAAYEAVTGSRPLDGLRGLALLSNGASRFVDPYGLGDWPALLRLLDAQGPEAVVHRVRAFEQAQAAAGRRVEPDDATVAQVSGLDLTGS